MQLEKTSVQMSVSVALSLPTGQTVHDQGLAPNILFLPNNSKSVPHVID